MLSWATSVCRQSKFIASTQLLHSFTNFYASELQTKHHPKIKFETLFPVFQKTALNLICSTVLLVSPDTPVLQGAKHECWHNPKGYSRTSFYGASAGFNSLGPSQVLSPITTLVPHSQLGKYHPLEATRWASLVNWCGLKISWVWVPVYQETLA